MHASLILAVVSLYPKPEAVTWPLNGLNGELNFIAYQESYYGKYVNHEPHARGPYNTAFGSLGLKGSTAHDTYLKSPWLQNRYPGLQDKSAFLNTFWHDAEFYMYCANFHWYSLRQNTPNIKRAVFSWRWGLTASNLASDEQIEADKYVTKYMQLENARAARTASARR